eukprot:TRINITY_DN5734_c0_g1_i4.p1 TRINITY_DN5734_c0_g1~~TRINITY_DN5734_c0_g1_i4.p1  ORF type:complete len:226 (+),score=50.10 TRINITY_DN5734_c0_g1_i4:401-1078(+)
MLLLLRTDSLLPLSFRSASSDDAFQEALYGSVNLTPDTVASGFAMSAPVLGSAVVDACVSVFKKTKRLPVVILDEFNGCTFRDGNGQLQISKEGSQFFLKLVDAYNKGQLSLVILVSDYECARLLKSLSGAKSRLDVLLYPAVAANSILPMLQNSDWYREIEKHSKNQAKPNDDHLPRETNAAMIEAIVNVVGGHMQDLLKAIPEVFGSHPLSYQGSLGIASNCV